MTRAHLLFSSLFWCAACATSPSDEPDSPPAPPPPPAATGAASLATPPADYAAWPACAKQAWVIEQGDATAYATLPSWLTAALYPAFLFLQDNRVSFDRASDVMPPYRLRRIHTFGSVAAVDVVPVGDPGWGMLAGGCGVLRLSLARAPQLGPYTPGLALKLFVDGEPSINVHAMPSLDGQGADHDFFARPFSNVLAPPTRLELLPLAALFATVDDHPLRVGLDRLATTRPDGVHDDAPVPAELVLAPADVHLPSATTVDLRALLADVPVGARVFAVQVRATPGAALVHVADVVTTSPFVASRFGDEALFFQHEEYAP